MQQPTNLKDKNKWLQTLGEIEAWLAQYNILGYKINPNFTVEVQGNVNLNKKGLTHIPVKFSYISGRLEASHNLLTSLEFCPPKIERDLMIEHNRLTSLEFCPEVGANLYVGNNLISSLVGAPKEIPNNFYCDNNPLTSLFGAPERVGIIFDCSDTLIKDLQYAPNYIGYYLRASTKNIDIKNPPFIPTYIKEGIYYEKNEQINFEELKNNHTKYLIETERKKLNNEIEKKCTLIKTTEKINKI